MADAAVKPTTIYPNSASRSAHLFERARNALPGGNSRHGVYLSPYPIYAATGKGCRVTDVDGNERIDCVNNWSSLIHGHCNDEIVAAVQAQAERLMAAGMPTQVEIELAELLVARLPGVDLVRFSNSGSEGVLFAVRAARAFTGRAKIAKVEGAYHGNIDAVEVSVAPSSAHWGAPHAPAPVPATDGIPPAVIADTLVLPFNDVQSTEALLREHGDALAAVVLDPVVSRMGLVAATPEYLRMVREVTHELGILLIFDEVFSFRLGYHGIQGEVGVTPDLTALGKIIGGGLPIGATGGRADVMAVFDQTRPPLRVEHGGTYNANPMSMAAGLACMRQMTPAMYTHLELLGDRLREGLRDALERTGVPGHVRGQGSLVALGLGATAAQNYRELKFGEAERRMISQLHRYLLNHGVQIVPYGMFILSTPMTTDDIDFIVAQTRAGLAEAKGTLA
jgi:glutamate-1-semialdehyde 2,1-aminomutase